MRVPATC
ncbi:hypothetical protein SAMN02787118_104194 [Streptomyces mirabilis]|nr:hypothetical protein SAMN02787118_104194 [Streptomyces mirabilis]